MKKQKFKRGDLVHIAKDLGPYMSHFDNDCDAIILGSYRDQYGGEDNVDDWSVLFCDSGGECSWYHTNQLTFIKHVGDDGIKKVEFERSKKDATQQDIHWIVANWLQIRERVPGATMAKLMELVGITNPWGSRGEGVDYYANAMATHRLLDPALSTGNMDELNAILNKLGVPQC